MNPENTFYSVKRFMGRKFDEITHEATEVSYKVQRDSSGNVKLECPQAGKPFAPEEISAQVLRKLVEDASKYIGETITQAVITVPAYFNDSQRQATKDAGKIAGIEVLRIINEPTAASLAYGFDKKSNETILVFDLGGGTFDVSILEVGDGVFEVLATSGDTHLGGDDFDKKIVDFLAEQFKKDEGIELRKDRQALQRLTEAAEKAKIELSSVTQAEINLPFITATQDGPKHLDTTLTRAKFEELCSDLIDRCRIPVENALRDAKLSKNDIDEVVLVGGSTRIPAVQQIVKQVLGKDPNQSVNPVTPEMAAQETGLPVATIQQLAREFGAARPSLAVAGGVGSQHAGATEVCAAVNILNYVAGNIGETVRFGADLDTGDGYGALQVLLAALDAGQVDVAMVHEANPAYTLPRTSGFATKFQKAGFKVSTSMYLDETSVLCDLLLPQHHPLERWDDLRPRAGVHSLMQPVMEPVFNTMATGDLLLRTAKALGGPLARFSAPSYKEHLQARWQALAAQRGEKDFAAFWHGALQRGGVFAAPPAAPRVSLAPRGAQVTYTRPAFEGNGQFVFATYAHSLLHDGRGANKPWLLENSDPVTKITWHSWVELHPDTARRLDLRDGEILRLTSPHGSIEAPVFVYQGIHPDVVAVPLGLGHTEYGSYARGRGVNALDLLGAPAGDFLPYISTRVSVEKTGGYKSLASIAGNPRQLGRGIAEAVSLDAAKKGLTVQQAYLAEGHGKHDINTEPELEAIKGWSEKQEQATKHGNYLGDHPRWGMAIDLAKCTGCQACVTACYAENNIPTVGETEIGKGREMTWIRIERYWEGGEAPGEPLTARFVPMLCQHCSNAPCEPVCPVYAAYHTPDGLNGQVYNRCVGTRYCANNCPYKVRYFNWYKYNQVSWPEPLHLQLNPDVTVRARGVMEKCTFCIQRIRGAQNDARLENRAMRDGDVVTACAQACPSDAIVFGDVNDPSSRVARLHQDPRGYRVLEDLNTRSAITYLAKVLLPAEA